MSEAYRVGITISLVNHVSSGLRLISRHLGDTGKSAAQLQATLDKIKLLGLGGAAAGAAGYMGLKAIGEAVKPAMQLEHQIQLMKSNGLDAAEVARATAEAWKIAGQVQTSSVNDVMASIAELRPVFGDIGEAIKAAGLAARMDAVLENVTGKKGDATGFSAAKALEFRGVALDPKRYAEEANLMTAAIQATVGKVGPADYLQFMRMSKGYGRGLSEDFVYGEGLRAMQELGASKTGNAIAMLEKEFSGGKKLTATEHDAMAKVGFLDAKGGIKSSVTAAMLADPYKFARDTLLPAMDKAGIHGDLATAKFLSHLTSNSNAMSLLTLLVTQGPGIEKDAAIAQQAKGIDSFAALVKADPTMQMKALDSSWSNFLTALGQTLIPIVVPALNKTVDALHAVTDWAREHQTAVKVILEVAAGLSTLALVFAVGSVFAIGIAALAAAPVLTAITAAGAALGVLAAALLLFWDDIKDVGPKISHFLGIDKLVDKMPHSADPNNPLGGFDLPGVGGTDQTNDPMRIFGSAFTPLRDRDRFHLGRLGTPGFDPFHPGAPPPSAPLKLEITNITNLDGRVISNVVSEHQVKAGTGPAPGVTWSDPMALPPMLQNY